MEKTIEQRAAQTILEESIGKLTLDGKTYDIPAPTTATLIMVSGLISELPELDLSLPEQELPGEMLHKAKDCGAVAKIAAAFILGAKKTRQAECQNWFTRLRRNKRIPRLDELADKLMLNCTPTQLRNLLTSIFSVSGIDDFFIITTSLRTRNLLAATRTEVGKTTASGLSSAVGQNTSK